MKIISVAAPCNGSGKTSLMLSLLRTFPEVFSVAKFTTIYREEQFCPVKDHECACRRLEGRYMICADQEVLAQPGTDTGKIWRAGAKQILWGVVQPEGYADLIEDLVSHYWKDGTPVLMEGNSVVQYLKPQLSLFVINPNLPVSWWKEDTESFLKQADFVVINPYLLEAHPLAPEVEISVQDRLHGIEGRRIEMEYPEKLDQWRDRRIYCAISSLLRN